MQNKLKPTVEILTIHKWLVLILAVIFFLLITIYIFFLPKETVIPPDKASSITESPTTFINIQQDQVSKPIQGETEGVDEISNRKGLIKTEIQPDESIKYYFTSPVAERNNIIIISKIGEPMFHSSVTLPEFPVKISTYIEVYGNAPWVFEGSSFYGPAAQTYIYPELGVAFIANPETEEVFEQHLFESVTVEEYVRKYGDDILANPEP